MSGLSKKIKFHSISTDECFEKMNDGLHLRFSSKYMWILVKGDNGISDTKQYRGMSDIHLLLKHANFNIDTYTDINTQ